MPIFSLPSPYGIGTLGKSAKEFIDFLHNGAQRLWQILPIGTTTFGDSPYQSFSCFAGNPYFIDLDLLINDNLLTEKEVKSFDFGNDNEHVDYEKLYNNRYKVLKIAFNRFIIDEDYKKFEKQNSY